MTLAEEHFGVPQVMHPEDLAVEKPDELSVMTYLSYFCCPDSVGQNALLHWVQQQIPHKNITNFTSDWSDGSALGALTDVVSGGAFPDNEEMSPDKGLENSQQSMEAADRLLGVKQTVKPEAFSDPDLDQLTRMTYLTQFQHAKPSSSPASRLTAAGPGITGDFAGKETNFLVRGRVPEWAKLDVAVLSPTGNKLPLKHHTTSTKATSYQYSPPIPGSYTVEVKLDNEHIPGSPFSVPHSAPSAADKCIASGPALSKAHVGETAEFSVNCEEGGPGDLVVEIHGPTGNVGTEIIEPTNRNYKVKFTPLESGPHTVSVQWDGKHVQNSPFTCLVTDPKKCVASGAGLTGAVVGERQNFTVKTDKAGPGTLSAEARGPSGNTVPVQIRDEGKGNFNCSWVPQEKGAHTIDVRWSDAPISGSPFKVNAAAPADAAKCTITDLPKGKLRAGKTYDFTVDATKAGSGDLKASALGPSVPEKCVVAETSDGVYAVNFTPMEVGKVKVSASYGDNAIPGSPLEFTINDPSKCKVNAAAIVKGSYRVKQPIDFRVSGQFAGEGNLTATVRGPKGGEDVEVKDQGDGTFLVHYIPKDGGPHAIDIQFDGEQIPDAPVRLFVEAGSNADSVVVTQPAPGRLGVYTVDHVYDYKVNTAGAGEAALTVTSHGARTGLKPKLDIVDIGNGQYTVSLNAKEPDDYHVSIMWGDEPVPGSPFKLPVSDKPKPDRVVCDGPHYTIGSTDPVTMSVDAGKAGAGELSATAYGDKVGSVPVEIKENEPKKYTVTFVPPATDVYSLGILWSDQQVKNSPFKVNLIPPDASKCIVTGPELPTELNKPVELRVDASNAGNGQLAAKAVGDTAGPTDVRINEVEPNVFDVSFIPPSPDWYDLDVTWGNESVPGAPFRLNLAPAKANEVFIAEPPTAMLEAGQSIGICFDTSKAGNGELTSVCRGGKVGEIPVKVTERTKDKYDINFTPPEPDVYTVDVLWSGKHVKGSPFTINLMPVDVSKVKVIGPTQSQGLKGPVGVMLQTAGAGKGKVTAACTGSRAGEVPVSIKETSADVYEVSFVPPQPDIYTFEVQYGGHNVKGSQFYINTIPPDASKVKVTEPETFELSLPVQYKVDAVHAGAGRLTASCRGDNYGAVQVEIADDGIGQYLVSFTPHHSDVYNLSLQWAGTEVPGSPFTANLLPSQADKVIVGDLHIPAEAGTGDPVWVDLDCSAAGQGEVTAKCKGNLVGDVPVKIEKTGRDKYRVKFQPPQADMYDFNVYYGGKDIRGSPFPINLVPPQPDKVQHTGTSLPEKKGDPISLDFNTALAGRGSLRAKARGDSVGPVDVKVKEKDANDYNVGFVPPEPDRYEIDVYWGDKPVEGSPFVVDTRPKVHPDKVECGEPVFIALGKPVDLAVDATNAGPGTLTAKCVSDISGDVPCEVSATSPSTYNVSFVPKREDVYVLAVFYDGVEVKDSPFNIDTRPKGPVHEQMEQRVLEQPVEALHIPEEWCINAPPDTREEEPLPTEFTNYIGEPTILTVDAEDQDQKKGGLTATAVGEKTGPADIEVKQNDDGTFDVVFNPDKPDRYTVDAKLDGESVPSTPFIVNYILATDPSRCYIFGLQDMPPVPQIDVPIKFGVDATEGGKGKLSVTSDGPSAEEEGSTLNVKPREDNPRIYDIVYTPTASGLHRIHLLWAKEAIPGSPLLFEVGDASAIQTYAHGKPVAMDINADCKLGDLESYAIHEETGTRYKVKIIKGTEKGKFKLSFQPKDPGIYAIHVLMKGKDIPGSPYRVRYAEPPDPGAVRVVGLSDKGYVHEPLDFLVDISEAGSGDLKIRALGPTSGNDADFSATDNNDGTYSAQYIPNAVGGHSIDITWADTSVPGSPFHIDVLERKPEFKSAMKGDGGVNVIEVGEPIQIRVCNLGDVDEDYIVAHCLGKNTGEAEVAVEKEDNGSYLIHFTPSVPDDYTLNVKLKEEDIEGSPFIIKAVAKGSLSPSLPHPKGLCHSDIEVGQPVNLIVPAAGVESADDVKVTNKGPHGLSETTVNDQLDGTLGVGFRPNSPGDYLLSVKKGDKDIDGSPYKITAVGKSDASKVHILEEDLHLFEKPLPSNRPARFRISTTDAGPGTLNITSRGPGAAEVKVFDNKDGTYTCEFTPTIHGRYTVDILWNDENIPGSPYVLNFKSKKTRVITGLDLDNENFRIGVPHRFKLHCGDVGEGLMEIRVKPPDAGRIRLTHLDTGANSYQCEVLPLQIGNHEISVQYNGKHILGSPFIVQFELRGDASKCRMIESSVEHQQALGDNVSFCISTEDAGNGLLTASVMNAATNERLPVSVSKVDRDLYNVDFNPGDGAEYLLTIKYDDQHILGSPFKLVFGPPTTDASQCRVEGDGIISAQVEKWTQFSVNAEDAGTGNLEVKIEGGQIEPVISTVAEHHYNVRYLPTKPGTYTIYVTWGGVDVPGSPFEVRCYNPADPSLLSIPQPVSETLLGQPVEFIVKSEGATNGELTAILQSSHNQNIAAKVSYNQEDGNYAISVDPPETGKYMMHVRWNGEHIKGSPFKVKVMTPPKPENVKAYGPGLDNGCVGQEGNFTVETGEGGAGTLAVRVHGPKGAFKINMRRHPENERTILVRYDPTHVGLYTVDITWSDVHIPGSPFKVDIAEQKK